jgi:hypothetical protein
MVVRAIVVGTPGLRRSGTAVAGRWSRSARSWPRASHWACRWRWWRTGTVSAAGSSMPGASSCCWPECWARPPTPRRAPRASRYRRPARAGRWPVRHRRLPPSSVSRSLARPRSRTIPPVSCARRRSHRRRMTRPALTTLRAAIVAASPAAGSALQPITVRSSNPAGLRRAARATERYAACATATASGGRRFHGSNCAISCCLVRPETRRSSTSVSQASGSTPFNFAV